MTVHVYQTKGGLVVGIDCPGLPLDDIDRLERRLIKHYNRNHHRYADCATVGDVNRLLESIVRRWLEPPAAAKGGRA